MPYTDVEEDDEQEPVSCFPSGGGRPRLLSKQCETCIFRPGNKMHLNAGRLKQMSEDACREGCQGVICHDTLPFGDHREFGPAVCRGFYDKMGYRNNFIRIMDRLQAWDEVDPPVEKK